MTPFTTSAKDPVISIRGLSASYGERRVLHGVDLEMYRGEIFVLLGGSGSGKTTLLKQVLGLAKPDAGTILVNGVDITACAASELTAVRRRIGVAFQGSALFSSMTIAENVALPLQELTQLADPIIALMVWMKLKAVGLANESDFLPHQLSGGMKKRAAIARAMALDPDILVFDEPSAGLDPIVAAGLDELILFLKRGFGMTVLVVTHEMQSALQIADRMALLHDGELVTVGTREEFVATHHPRARQFLERTAGPRTARRRPTGSRPLSCEGFTMSLEAKVGVFVIVSLLVLGATVYFVRTTQDVRGQVVYTTYLRYAGGIAAGTPVLFAGIRVGQVASVRPSAADPTRIEITFTVKAGTPVNEESIARVGSVTLMSSPTLFLTGGSNNARRLGPGELVPSQEAVGQTEIAARFATLADSANDVMTLLKQEVPAVTGEARAVLANLREISGTKNQKHVESYPGRTEHDGAARVAEDRAHHRTHDRAHRSRGRTGRVGQAAGGQSRSRGHQRQHHRRCRSRAADQRSG